MPVTWGVFWSLLLPKLPWPTLPCQPCPEACLWGMAVSLSPDVPLPPDCTLSMTNGASATVAGTGGTTTPTCDPTWTITSAAVLTCNDGTFSPAAPTCKKGELHCIALLSLP